MKQRLCIYKAVSSSLPDHTLLNLEQMQAGINITIPECVATLYTKQELDPKTPEWANFFIGNITTDGKKIHPNIFGKTSNTGAMLVLRHKKNTYLISFGTAHHIINDSFIVRNFGLKVTLNLVSHKKIKSLDKTNHNESTLHTRNQSSKEINIFDLNIDAELDILRTLTGKADDALLGPIATGRDSLIITPEININNLSSLLEYTDKLYRMSLPDEFKWVDNIKRSDKEESDLLDIMLIEKLSKNDYQDISLGEPEVVDWENQIGYSFENRTKSEILPFLSLDHLISYFKVKGFRFDIHNLKSKKIHILNDHNVPIKAWSIYRCLYVEVKNDNREYMLRNGEWYAVSHNFINEINNSISSIPQYEHQKLLPTYNSTIEEEYNEYCCKIEKSFLNMDKNFIYHGKGNSKIEVCDIIKDGRDFIHVKYQSGSHAMSHLFSQGYVSSELFLNDRDFRKKFNLLIPEAIKLKDHITRPISSNYRIVFAIASNRKIPDDLPFFSKINLKNFYRSINNLGFNVCICGIPVDPEIEKLKRARPKEKSQKRKVSKP